MGGVCGAVVLSQPPANTAAIMGDSKSISSNAWPGMLTSQPPGSINDNAAVSGATVASALADITARLAILTHSPTAVLMNWGVNDITSGLPVEATWEANYLSIIDQVHAKWPLAQIYLTRPWKAGFDASAATLHTWIDVIVAARAAFVHVGDDEAIWLKGSDNGASETLDGIHYAPYSEQLKSNQMAVVLGWP